ncbi:vam6/Vps39-like protein [Copidosoma floridanum]|uniref:vam6/Vps39-like protein n=1 Tax=Copidosoma floridanum TaxID=29053 RepID=UPI000C6F4E79|nr:vam6/Vps39-like protein [Copidosoma floridanum]
MEQFLKLGTNPYDVIRLFPDLVSQEPNVNEQSDLEPQLPKLQDRDLESGLLALIDFLTEVRYKLINDSQAKANEKSKGKSIPTEKSKNTATDKLLKIIDTTLLKCYLQTNDALVAPLLRLNHCHLAEAEKTLLQHQKYPELIILYQIKGGLLAAQIMIKQEMTSSQKQLLVLVELPYIKKQRNNIQNGANLTQVLHLKLRLSTSLSFIQFTYIITGYHYIVYVCDED